MIRKSLKHISTEESVSELTRRKTEAGELTGSVTMTDMEIADQELCDEVGSSAVRGLLEKFREESSKPKRCPQCKRWVPVRAKNRLRTVHTLSGDVT